MLKALKEQEQDLMSTPPIENNEAGLMVARWVVILFVGWWLLVLTLATYGLSVWWVDVAGTVLPVSSPTPFTHLAASVAKATNTPTATATSTATPTATETATPSPTATNTATPTATATATSTAMPTATETATPSPTATSTATATPARPLVADVGFVGGGLAMGTAVPWPPSQFWAVLLGSVFLSWLIIAGYALIRLSSTTVNVFPSPALPVADGLPRLATPYGFVVTNNSPDTAEVLPIEDGRQPWRRDVAKPLRELPGSASPTPSHGRGADGEGLNVQTFNGRSTGSTGLTPERSGRSPEVAVLVERPKLLVERSDGEGVATAVTPAEAGGAGEAGGSLGGPLARRRVVFSGHVLMVPLAADAPPTEGERLYIVAQWLELKNREKVCRAVYNRGKGGDAYKYTRMVIDDYLAAQHAALQTN